MLNIAQIGIGYWGPNLLRNLMTNKRCNVTRVVDLSADRRDYVNGLYPAVKTSDDVMDVINDPEIDAVVIATPVKSHFELAMAALKAGKHILVEKPMATSSAEIEEMEKVATEKKLTAMAGHTFIFNAAVRYVKELIDSGTLGEVRYICSQRLNLGRIRNDVDALWNFAPHDISIIQYWLGDPEPIEIHNMGMDFIQSGINDVVFSNIKYPNKVMANIHVSWLDPRKVRQMTIVGSKKMVVYDDIAENKIVIFDKGIEPQATLGDNMDYDNQHFRTFQYRSGDILMPKIQFDEPLKVEIDHFIDCMEGKESCITGVDHAKKVVGILEQNEAV